MGETAEPFQYRVTCCPECGSEQRGVGGGIEAKLRVITTNRRILLKKIVTEVDGDWNRCEKDCATLGLCKRRTSGPINKQPESAK